VPNGTCSFTREVIGCRDLRSQSSDTDSQPVIATGRHNLVHITLVCTRACVYAMNMHSALDTPGAMHVLYLGLSSQAHCGLQSRTAVSVVRWRVLSYKPHAKVSF
jgi:hypothetical protein